MLAEIVKYCMYITNQFIADILRKKKKCEHEKKNEKYNSPPPPPSLP